MHPIDIASIDLNLLVALDALLAEQQVTRAARRVGRTQSSMSHALSRLRELFGDPLLVRSGRGMVLTRRAEALREPLSRALAELARIVRDEGPFDAARSTRTFVLSCPDLLAPALPALLSAMRREAPSAGLVVRPSQDSEAELAAGTADVALGRAPMEGSELRARSLGTLTWAVIARGDHPARRRFSAREWVRYPHVQVATGNGTPNIVDGVLARAGLTRRIGVVVPGFLVAPEVVAHTDFFFTAPRELIRPIAERLGLAVLYPPIAIDPLKVVAIWHERVGADAAHEWFRGVIARVVEEQLRPKKRASRERAARRR